MARLTRRAFLQSSVGAATGVAAAGTIGVATTGVVAAIVGEGEHAAANEPIVAYVRNGAKGEMTLLVGHREISYRDPVLVNKLVRAAR
jgi:hypothetical protein